MDYVIVFASGLLTGVIGLWAVSVVMYGPAILFGFGMGVAFMGCVVLVVSVVMAGGKRTPVPGKANREPSIAADMLALYLHEMGHNHSRVWGCCTTHNQQAADDMRKRDPTHTNYNTGEPCYCGAGEWATPENVAQAEERLTS